MKGRLVGLGLVAACELLGGVGLRNEALAARARAEICRRRLLLTEGRQREHAAFLAWWTAPDQVVKRMQLRPPVPAARWRPEL